MLYKLPDLAYNILDSITENQTMTQEELTTSLNVDPDSVKYAIRRLQEHDLIQQIPDLMDMRIVHYRLPTEEELREIESNLQDDVKNKIFQYIRQGDHSRSIGEKSQAMYKTEEGRV